MSNLNLNASAGVDLSTPFCARTYFHGLREAGVRPYASAHTGKTGHGRYCDDPEANVRALPWHRWACKQDPDQKVRDNYVVALLDKHRRTDDDLVVIQLGICDDEMEPEVHRVLVRAAAAEPV
ncbi:hypothetical protein GA0061099_1005401 [Bradyrhizobium yuanmingense]|uniref:Uncharacterized protein n=1 Tax=Bradyrhizobium yuanmingense TaxID=108015 RepID=A0A1C3W7V9_9BRAD|nr:hypothetical protein [Bradyrhizobium yuanmingense]TWI27388.1 hypothetical protein IQ15_02923 [Bradyrhizobium yuanmingense]SCB35965.1 hypothetical protein GA0061099_1005401 [Bradyrhizobium yuanmingense]